MSSGLRGAARGAVAGAAAWWAMDRVLRFLYDHEASRVRQRERAARDGVPALEVLAQRLASRTGRSLSARQRHAAGTALQWIMGIGAGAVYAALRRHLPGGGIPRGVGYGVGFWLLVDETLTPLLGLAPGPAAFPWQTHARGLAGHLVYGAVAEAVVEALEPSARDG